MTWSTTRPFGGTRNTSARTFRPEARVTVRYLVFWQMIDGKGVPRHPVQFEPLDVPFVQEAVFLVLHEGGILDARQIYDHSIHRDLQLAVVQSGDE